MGKTPSGSRTVQTKDSEVLKLPTIPSEVPSGYSTFPEIAKKLGISEHRVRVNLMDLCRKGTVDCTVVSISRALTFAVKDTDWKELTSTRVFFDPEKIQRKLSSSG